MASLDSSESINNMERINFLLNNPETFTNSEVAKLIGFSNEQSYRKRMENQTVMLSSIIESLDGKLYSDDIQEAIKIAIEDNYNQLLLKSSQGNCVTILNRCVINSDKDRVRDVSISGGLLVILK